MERTVIEEKSVIDILFHQKKELIIVGLTGRTGSGCTTVAKFLSSDYKNFSPPVPKYPQSSDEERGYKICYNYLAENWTKANCIIVTHLIIFICLKIGTRLFFKNLKEWINKMYDEGNQYVNKSKPEADELIEEINDLMAQIEKMTKINLPSLFEDERGLIDDEKVYDKLKEKQSYESNEEERSLIKKFIEITLPKHYENFKDITKRKGKTSLFTEIFQLFGNYIRYSSFFDEDGDCSITNIIDYIIQFYKYYNDVNKTSTLIVIDALRNPYEISFLRKKYASFYAMSIRANEEERKNRLHSNHSEEAIKKFDETEYPPPSRKITLKELFTYQNIEKCTEISDLHIMNAGHPKFEPLKMLLVRYISLMKHPGLIPPTNEERTMQIAFTAKYNSGCISRQVGAVITNENFIIKAIGWNDAPEGHVSCILRDSDTLLNTGTSQEALFGLYSSFEITERKKYEEEQNDKNFCYCLQEKFYVKDKSVFKGRNISYCFKDIRRSNKFDSRALHAEENAFLQIVKYGGQGILGGKLFTTASPCELCAKKSYQLGIKDIYYIDLYPGISQQHILECGKKDLRPKMHIFEGAIGRAYISLYQPLISYKDEINEIIEHEKKKGKFA